MDSRSDLINVSNKDLAKYAENNDIYAMELLKRAYAGLSAKTEVNKEKTPKNWLQFDSGTQMAVKKLALRILQVTPQNIMCSRILALLEKDKEEKKIYLLAAMQPASIELREQFFDIDFSKLQSETAWELANIYRDTGELLAAQVWLFQAIRLHNEKAKTDFFTVKAAILGGPYATVGNPIYHNMCTFLDKKKTNDAFLRCVFLCLVQTKFNMPDIQNWLNLWPEDHRNMYRSRNITNIFEDKFTRQILKWAIYNDPLYVLDFFRHCYDLKFIDEEFYINLLQFFLKNLDELIKDNAQRQKLNDLLNYTLFKICLKTNTEESAKNAYTCFQAISTDFSDYVEADILVLQGQNDREALGKDIFLKLMKGKHFQAAFPFLKYVAKEENNFLIAVLERIHDIYRNIVEELNSCNQKMQDKKNEKEFSTLKINLQMNAKKLEQFTEALNKNNFQKEMPECKSYTEYGAYYQTNLIKINLFLKEQKLSNKLVDESFKKIGELIVEIERLINYLPQETSLQTTEKDDYELALELSKSESAQNLQFVQPTAPPPPPAQAFMYPQPGIYYGYGAPSMYANTVINNQGNVQQPEPIRGPLIDFS